MVESAPAELFAAQAAEFNPDVLGQFSVALPSCLLAQPSKILVS